MSDDSLIDKLRSVRIAKMAVFDWACSILGAAALAYWLNLSFIILLLGLLLVSIPVHMILGVRTYTNYYLGLDEEPNPPQ